MPIFVLLYLAAGALVVGGPAAGYVVYRRANSSAAAWLESPDRADVERELRNAIVGQELRDEARRHGVDPDLVERGHVALRDGLVPLDKVIGPLRGWLS